MINHLGNSLPLWVSRDSIKKQTPALGFVPKQIIFIAKVRYIKGPNVRESSLNIHIIALLHGRCINLDAIPFVMQRLSLKLFKHLNILHLHRLLLSSISTLLLDQELLEVLRVGASPLAKVGLRATCILGIE